MKFGISLKLGMLLAGVSILASGLTGFYAYQASRNLLEKMAAALVERKLIAGAALDELTARVTMVVNSSEGSESPVVEQISTAEANSSKMLDCVPQADSFRDNSGPQGREGPA